MPNYTTEIEAIKNEINSFYQQRQIGNYKEALGAGRIFAEAVCKLIIQSQIDSGLKSNPFQINISGNKLVRLTISSSQYKFEISNSVSNPNYGFLMLGKLYQIIQQIISETLVHQAIEILKDEGNPAHHATGGRANYTEAEWQICEPQLNYLTTWLFNSYLNTYGITMSTEISVALQNKLNRKFLTTLIPNIDLNEIIGRESDLIQIENLLKNQKKVVLVNGIGGIGKTYLAKAYLQIHKSEFDHIIYIEQNTTLKSAFVNEPNLSNNLLINFNPTDTEVIRFEKILNTLRNDFKGNGLIIVDNANEEIVSEISKFPNTSNWNLLITSRDILQNFENYRLDHLTTDKAIELFRYHYKKEIIPDQQIIKLLELIDCHTLTIVLLAKTLQNHHNLTFQSLLNTLIEKGLNIDRKVFIDIDHEKVKSKAYLFDCLLTIFDLSNIKNNTLACEILKNLSILPSTYISYIDLLGYHAIKDNNKDDEFNNAINDLVAHGWLDEKNNTFKCHIIIQEICKFEFRPTFENSLTVIEYLNSTLELNNKIPLLTKQKYIPFAENVLKIISCNNKKIFHLNYFISNTLKELGIYDYALKFATNAEKIANNLKDTNLRWQIYSHFGILYRRYGNFEKSFEYYEKAIFIIDNIKEKDISMLLVYSNFATFHENIGNKENLLEAINIYDYVIKEIKLYINNYGTDNEIEINLAHNENSLGKIYNLLGNYNKAIELQLKSFKKLLELKGNEDFHVAICANNLALSYGANNDYSNSLKYHLLAVEIETKILPENHPEIAISKSGLANAYRNLGKLDLAKKIFKEVHDTDEKILPKNHPAMARRKANLAVVCLFPEEKELAKKLYREAIEIEQFHFGTNNPNVGLSIFNLGIIYLQEKDYKGAIENFQKALRIFLSNYDKEHEYCKIAIEHINFANSMINKK